ncbi:response regulator transcription factor [Microlunatus soli]|uniref:Two component transcriptional regulator, LuxR family n=1 Tax=Microlunatus soli TaxID=630515 RepID=A0A1H1WKX5_9ACTN|nr:response regulator transcription factor [Microlunatus soli]SDS97745.1 two component transcriptional regulator, LuxR family [Microlunatus soli]
MTSPSDGAGLGADDDVTAANTIRILLADDQALIRQAFAALLGLEPDIEVVGQASDASEVVALAAERHPDVIVMDVQMPDPRGGGAGESPDGITATAKILAADPGIRVIIVTTFGRPGYLRRAMEAGAVGFMVKDAPADQLIEGIRRVHRGLRVVDPTLAAASLSVGPSPLTERETEVLAAAAHGGATSAIAGSVFLSEGTVRNHLSSAMGKLGAATRAEAVRIATENGWLP